MAEKLTPKQRIELARLLLKLQDNLNRTVNSAVGYALEPQYLKESHLYSLEVLRDAIDQTERKIQKLLV